MSTDGPALLGPGAGPGAAVAAGAALPGAARRPAPASVAGHLADGRARGAITFAGQAVDPVRELAALVRDRPEAAATVAVAADVLEDVAEQEADGGRYRHGLDVSSWVLDPDAAPPASYLRSTAVSHPLILLAQLAAWRLLWADGLAAVVAGGGLVAATGHSQGLYAALAVAAAPGGEVDDDRLARALRLVAAQGRAMADADLAVGTDGEGDPLTPMAAVSGVRLARLAPVVDEVAARLPGGALVIALHNAPTRFVVSGRPEALGELRARLSQLAREEEADRRRGRRGGTPLRFAWSPLAVSSPFHGPLHDAARRRFLAEVDRDLLPSADELWMPVLSGADGSDLRTAPDLLAAVADGQFTAPVRWDRAVRGLVDLGADWVLDLGPGTDVARFGTELVRGTGARALALASPEGRRLLLTPDAAPDGPDLRYADLAPGLVALPDGRCHVDNRHTRLTGRPAVVLAGMTPTTADVAIVAGAADAGYAAELAGSGQPTAATFERRIAELTEVLAPGVEVGFNALYLDRHLWELQFGRQELVWKARRGGAPLDGVTVSAGIPEVDEAVALLDRLVAHGMVRNAFKPGTADQVRQVLAIADAAPQHTITVQLEGGKAGGHHSWEDLDELLLATYGDLRLRRNVVLVAGGGIASPARAADLLTGSWSERHGELPMPLDGVLLGTVAMATAESTASPQVKQALVDAPGTADWVPWRGVGGGVTSGRSNLDADIHTLDNAAAVAGHLLEEVAGDRDAIAARHHEIVAALARTAKPWFGDLDELTYAEVLARFAERCATGRHGRYDDGAWADPSWREMALELYRAFAARLAPEQTGPVAPPVAVAADLDDPDAALATFTAAYPSATTERLHPADRDRFVAACARPGKPVPFVPVLDGEVRRWYMADALWQAHDDRYPADAVFVIPGPEAVAGITRVDEPVADLLARFEAATIDRLTTAGVVPERRDRLADPGPLPPHLGALVAGRTGPLADLVAVASVVDGGRRRPNPLWRLVRAGDRVDARVADGRLVSFTAHPAGGEGERVSASVEADRLVVEVTVPTAGGTRVTEAGVTEAGVADTGADAVAPAGAGCAEVTGTAIADADAVGQGLAADPRGGATGDRLSMRLRSIGRPGRPAFELVDGDAARAAWYRRALLGAEGAAGDGGPTDGAADPADPAGAAEDRPGVGAGHGGERSVEGAAARWRLGADRLVAYRGLTGAEHLGVPLDLAFTLAWPALVQLLAGTLAPRLADLLHAEHRVVPGPAWPPAAGDAGTATVAVDGTEDRDGARWYRCRAEVVGTDGLVATVHATLAVRLTGPDGEPVARDRRVVDVTFALDDAVAAVLDGCGWAHPVRPLVAAGPTGAAPWVRLRADTAYERHADGRAVATATGTLELAGADGPGHHLAEVRLDATGDLAANPVAAFADVVVELAGGAERADPAPTAGRGRVERPRAARATADDVAPGSAVPFARVGGDHNPLHRSVLAARLAGLDEPVLHGLWTAARAGAFVVDEVAGGDPSRLVDWRVRFTAPVLPGAILDLSAERVGAERGATWVEVLVRADDVTVAVAEALVSPPTTALVFPGQGVQRTGLGRDGRDRSAAARAVWARADGFTRERLGFSLLDVVDRNPSELTLGGPDGETLRHPDGVLFLTELTQVAMAALAAAQLAELDHDGGRTGRELVAGHSIGEFNALAALGVLPLEVVLELVWERGRAMQRHVPRDDRGASPYRFAVVDPAAAGLDQAGVEALVAEVAAATGAVLEVVNHNAPGRQHAVAGTEASLAALADRLAARQTGTVAALRPVPGIDVPFHSSVLAPAAVDLRDHLERLVPARVDHRALVGRWVPNLVGRPFALDADFASLVAAASGAPLPVPPGAPTSDLEADADADARARDLLVTLLAEQLAAPVQWVETQRTLARSELAGGLAVARIVEVGPQHAAVLANLARTTYAAEPPGGAAPEVLHVERDRPRVLGTEVADEIEAPDAPAESTTGSASGPSAGSPTGSSGGALADPPLAVTPPAVAGSSPVGADDRPVGGGDALRAVVALQARVRPDQLRDDERLDDLFGGASSRRNQVLIDLGRELGLSGTDGAQDLTLGRFQADLAERTARYRFPGPYLRDTVASGLARVLGPSGLGRGEAVAHLTGRWGLGPGLVDQVLLRLVLDTRPGPSARGGDLASLGGDPPTTPAAGRALVDLAVERVGGDLGLALRPVAVDLGDGEPALGAAAAGHLTDALVASARELAAGLGRPFAEPGHRLEAADDTAAGSAEAATSADRLAALDAELGAARAAEVAPAFDHRRHVRFASGAASARWDLITLAHDALAGRLDPAVQRDTFERLAPWGCEPSVAATARWFAARARHHDRPDLAAALDDLAGPHATARTVASTVATAPQVQVAVDGTMSSVEVPAPDRPGDVLDALAGDDRDLVAGWHARLVASSPSADGSRADGSPADGSLADGSTATDAPSFAGEVALVTGASPGSIAVAAVRTLLQGGATVVVATSTLTLDRRRWYRDLFREAAGPGAELHLVPANLASFADIDALVAWLADPEVPQRGRRDLTPPSLLPTIVLPFAALPTVGTAAEAGAASEVALRVQLLGVQRMVAAIGARVGERRPARPATVVLPLSPNHGTFGGDGPYGETKAGLEVLATRARSEAGSWGAHVRVVPARIGWVRGTRLMGHNDAVAALVEERLGVRTWCAAEMGWLLAHLAGHVAARPAATDGADLAVDLGGGLDRVPDLRAALVPLGAELLARGDVARREAALRAALAARLTSGAIEPRPTVAALPSPVGPPAPGTSAFTLPPGTDPADLVVIVGAGELGPHGLAATRFEAEVDGAPSPAGVVELAWLCGLVAYEGEGSEGRWIDLASGDEVDEAAIADRYAEEVVARTGVRPLESDGAVEAEGLPVLATVHLDRDLTFDVASEEEARSFLAADPAHTEARLDPGSGSWRVTRTAGGVVRVPRQVPHTRRVAGQFPTGLDLGRFGIPGELTTTADRIALVNLACTVEAFADAGTTPEELLGEVHPALVANTQGAGMGGMASLRRLLLDHLLDTERQNDRLQESLGNVVAAHTVQGYVGSYGPMVHPVAACATAAVSLEVAHDKIRAGQALAVLSGGYDDIIAESVLGFGDMHATADSDELDAMGILPCEASRANDVRRRGFVEAQGGGSTLVVRGDVALALGLPVQAVLAYAGSFGDGINTSIPAPGLGLVAAARGGDRSPLAAALARHGLTADDVAVVSKHDTSTEMNDPNEAEVHHRIQDALGRTPGNPLLVVSQKTVTGHAKGGAAAWQVGGVLSMLATGVVPGNRTLESLDPLVARHDHLAYGHRPVRLAPQEPLRAALVTSLGFGHVSAVVALAHPDLFLAAVPEPAREAYRERAAARRATGRQRRLRTRLGRPDPVRRTDRRLPEGLDAAETRDAEAAVLLDAGARLGPGGRLASP